MKNKAILITGASGYLGTRLCARLFEKGFNIIALTPSKTDIFKFDKRFAKQARVYYLDKTPLEKIFKENKIDVVIHLAALYGRLGETPCQIAKVNLLFPLEVLQNAVKYGVKTFINTDTILSAQLNPYALTKAQFAQWLNFYAAKIRAVNLRLDHFYGPFDKPIKFIAFVFEQIKTGAKEINLTEGSQTRDFIYIDDVISAYLCILKNLDKIPLGKFNNFETATDSRISIKDLVTFIKKETKSKIKLNFGAVPYRENEILSYDIDTSALRALGWKPKVFIERGIKKIIKEEGLLR